MPFCGRASALQIVGDTRTETFGALRPESPRNTTSTTPRPPFVPQSTAQTQGTVGAQVKWRLPDGATALQSAMLSCFSRAD